MCACHSTFDIFSLFPGSNYYVKFSIPVRPYRKCNVFFEISVFIRMLNYVLENPGFESLQGQNAQSGPGSHPTSYTVGNWCFSSGTMRPERDADNSSTSIDEAKNEWSYASAPLHAFMACLGTDNLIFFPLSPWRDASSGCGAGKCLQMKRAAVNLLHKEPWIDN
jgi:hypothetical protein